MAMLEIKRPNVDSDGSEEEKGARNSANVNITI